MRALIYLIVGAVLAAVGIFWIIAAGHTVAGILAGLVTALGTALVATSFAVFTDLTSPTSKKI